MIEPDFKISIGRRNVPFVLGEVGVSDGVEYTKLKRKIWIEREVSSQKCLSNSLDKIFRRSESHFRQYSDPEIVLV